MKLTHVFGLVAAIHLAAFTVIFATPGCRSTGKAKPRPDQTDPVAAGVTNAPVDNLAGYPAPSMTDADINAGYPSSGAVSYTPVAPVPVGGVSDGTVRFAPTRPAGGVAPITTAPEPVVAPVSAAPSATHTVVKGDSLWSISRKYGVSVAELAAANKLSPSATLRLDQKLVVPAKAASSPAAAATSDAANTYEVKAGDTLGAIARREGTTVAALRTANNLSGDNLRVGQKLVIPGNAAPLSASSAAASAPSASASAAPRAGSSTHTVVAGETLGAIARTYGVRVGEIATLNNITDPAKLRVGQVLRLPSGARAATSATVPTQNVAPATPATPVRTPAPAPAPLAPRFDEPTPITPINPIEPVEPVTPVEPAAVPVIRID